MIEQRPPPLIYSPPKEPFLRVLYCDDDLLVVAKQSGLLSVPGRGVERADCIATRAQALYPDATIVHRLDLDTSGVMIMARNRLAHRCLSSQFEMRRVSKTYVAKVWGILENESGEVDAPLICDWPNRPRQIVDRVNGRAALTAWRVVERNPNATRVQLSPRTGRSHQIRVHMLSIGHPILGDNLYAHPAARDAAERLQLHAQSISFRHPANDSTVLFEDACSF